ncbi:hypothetical protein Tco_1252038 [Tanacetum coccineum]
MWDVGMTQAGSRVAGLSSSSRGFHQSLRDGTFGTVPKSSSPEECSLSVGTESSFSLDDEDGGGGGICEDPQALKAPRAPKDPREGGGGGGGGGGPEGVLVLRRGSSDLNGFCRTKFPTFVVEESVSCQF